MKKPFESPDQIQTHGRGIEYLIFSATIELKRQQILKIVSPEDKDLQNNINCLKKAIEMAEDFLVADEYHKRNRDTDLVDEKISEQYPDECINLQFTECGNNHHVYTGWTNQLEHKEPQTILNEVKDEIEFYRPHSKDNTEIKATTDDIRKWLEKCRSEYNTYNKDNTCHEDTLCIAIVQTDGGYDQYDLEYEKIIE